MVEAAESRPRVIRSSADRSPRYYWTGMWSFVMHRISGVAITLFLVLHIIKVMSVIGGADGFNSTMGAMATRPFVLGEWLLFLALSFHGVNGIRLIMHDYGLGVARQKAWFRTVFVLSGVLVVAGSWYFVARFLAYPWS